MTCSLSALVWDPAHQNQNHNHLIHSDCSSIRPIVKAQVGILMILNLNLELSFFFALICMSKFPIIVSNWFFAQTYLHDPHKSNSKGGVSSISPDFFEATGRRSSSGKYLHTDIRITSLLSIFWIMENQLILSR